MASFYPRVLVRITATLQLSRTKDVTTEVVFYVVPTSIKLDRNEFSKADEVTLEFESVRFPVLPRSVRQMLVQVYLGDGRALDVSDADFATVENLVFIGYADDPELALSESEGAIRFKARDFTGLLLDAKRPTLAIVPTYGDSLRVALRRILDALPGGENIGLRLQVAGERTREWPFLDEAAPDGLHGEKLVFDPNDTFWKLIERCCDPFGLIPRIELDTLIVSTSRGADPPPRRPLFVLGANLVDYREKRNLIKLHEGIALNGYDLSTQSYVVAQWPPAGDQSVSKKIAKVATGKSGKKTKAAPPTKGANGAIINPNDKRHWFTYGAVANEETLLAAAKSIYETRSIQEFEGSFVCGRMRVVDDTPNGSPYDVLKLTSGDQVVVDVLPQHRQLLAGLDATADRVEYLVDQGYTRDLAVALVRVFESGVEDGLTVFVRSGSMSLTDGEGFRLSVQFQAMLAAEASS